MVIVGPTAVGKTKVAIDVAKSLQTEIVSADSRQMFREMNIGTAKPDNQQLQEVKHHFINSHSIVENYDAAMFAKDALKVIESIFETRPFAVMCGGSGLYVKAVCEGFDDIPAVPEEIRNELVQQYERSGLQWLQEKMNELDPSHLKNIDPNNPQRLIRALEVRIGTGLSISHFQRRNKHQHKFNILKIGLELPRAILYERIEQRMDDMIAQGLFGEAKNLYRYKEKNALQTVGYQEIFDFIDGAYDYDEAVRLLKRNSRRYAKRQLTWFKADPDPRWFAPDQVSEIMDYILQHN